MNFEPALPAGAHAAGCAPFRSFFLAGFECSSHRRRDGRRLDLVAATRHDRHVEEDYRRVAEYGLRTVRDGLRWHLIERSPGHYNWTSLLPALRAARQSGLQMIWDLCHYGYPDDLDIWGSEFVDRFARFAAAAVRVIQNETDDGVFVCPINEISYWAWAGGDAGRFNPTCRGRGGPLKRQLVRAAVAGIEALREAVPGVTIIHTDPLINVMSKSPRGRTHAARYHDAQFEALDMLLGRVHPDLGGRPELVDVIGVNYYPHNQWLVNGGTVPLGHQHFRPLHELLGMVQERYGLPLLIAETGAEGSARAAWLSYVGGEAREAIAAGIDLRGICLYPIQDYPGWDNGRHCKVGLIGLADRDGVREVHAPLAEELHRQQMLFANVRARRHPHLGLVGRAG
jgi:beta-glucosidase/6-phospho-beta-glucosidase/beta-galactosidase